ncbi:hypothetical protein B0J17DRAFT_736241 [Rhizoctonia solani]|nr:hypothetical protein B0J17DRAFT_736241 [Rhizoctonia solani]
MSVPPHLSTLEHLAYSVFLPPKLPQVEQERSFQKSVDLTIIRSVIQACQEFSTKSEANPQWSRMEQMLQRLDTYTEASPQDLEVQLRGGIKDMKPGDLFPLYVRAQNAAVFIRKQADHTTFEVFEAQAQTEDVMVPSSAISDDAFVNEVSNILARMTREILPQALPKSERDGKDYKESHDTINPNYFLQYFLAFLHVVGATIDPPRVVKRLNDDVIWMGVGNPWRRSPIWLIVRIALQTSLDSTITYKHLMAYYHASILSQCSRCDGFSSDLLYAMRIKMARRLYKVQVSAPQFLIDFAKDTAESTQVLLQERWDAVQSAQVQTSNQDFSHCDFESAINQTLPNSRDYLRRVFEGRSCVNNPPGFTPAHSPRLENILEFSQYSNGALSRAFSNDPHLALFDFENSVFDNLSYWTSSHWSCFGGCAIISSCFRQYLAAAKSYYTVDVADQSIMILTLVRLWMAIDELATSQYPLLLEFSPELSDTLLDPLLLRTAQHINQARIIQQYIHGRHVRASPNNISIFSDRATDSSFAVQYFRMSPCHQKLKLDIEKHAQEQRNQKIQELKDLNARSQQLSGEIQGMTHQYYEIAARSRKQHSKFCERCVKEKQKRGISIQIHEWPLPPDQLEAETVVFELDLPEPLTVWRDVTYEILVDLDSSIQREGFKQGAFLEKYGALAPWRSTPANIHPRVAMASSSGSFNELRHNRAILIPANEDQVCVDNPLHFKLYDTIKGTWASGPFPDVTLADYGTLKLPKDSSYRHLEYALKGTTHTTNEVLADQYECPKELNLHEHIAFGTLRSGACLQWMNIVRGLEENLLTFSSEEVQVLHTQAVWQMGPLSPGGLRRWHEDLGHLEFGRLLVSQCRRVLDRVKANWLQGNSVLIIVTLVGRLLASIPTEEITQVACNFLREARDVAHQWLRELKAKLHSASHEDIISYQHRVCEVAILCRATYDVELFQMGQLLSTSNDYNVLIESFIDLYDNKPPDHRNAPTALQTLLCRDRRFAHKMAPYLLTSISHHSGDILSSLLHKIWPDYQRGSTGWRALEAPNRRWIATTVAGAKNDRTQEVHLNLLTGQLLVDGKPFGRLPLHYTEHKTYVRLFGQKILEVFPAKSPGMEFATRDIIHGYQVSFALERSNNQLIIQARKPDQIYELVPHEMLSKDLPALFSEDYHHWADIQKRTVEFYPISGPWLVGECRWLLRLEDPQTTTLENSADGSFLLSVELPRMKLSFFINKDMQLESRNFRGQIVDENQSAGTFFGLINQLLLREKGTITHLLPQFRSVLVPDGKIDFKKCGHHVSVSILLDSQRDVDVHRYILDNNLGYLTTDAGLTSRLLKIYLHALTSHCLPDPLTGHTGTEEALNALSQASTLSFAQIDLKQAELLKAIGQLTPKREYYPKHLKCMQKIRWAEIPSLSQHFAFSFASTVVLRRAETLQLFHPLDFKIHDYIGALESSDTLAQRVAQRMAGYYPPDSAYLSHIIHSAQILDSVCPGRDDLMGDWGEVGQVAAWASELVRENWGKPVFKPYNLVFLVELYNTLDDTEEHDTLSYHSSWFEFNLKSSWINLYNLLRHATISSNKYMLTACLAGIAFGQKLPTELIPVLLAFSTNPEFRSLDPPYRKTFQFKDGYEPTREHLEKSVLEVTYPLESTPAGALVRNEDESSHDFLLRKQSYYSTHLSKCQSELVEFLINQWPRTDRMAFTEICSPSVDYSRWLDVVSCRKLVGEYFSSCISNIEMKDHLRKLEALLVSYPTSFGTTFAPVNHENSQTSIPSRTHTSSWGVFIITNLMCSRPAPNLADSYLLSSFSVPRRTGKSTDETRLAMLIAEFRQSENPLNRRYGANLDHSRRELKEKQVLLLPRLLTPATMTFLSQTREHRADYLVNAFQQFTTVLSPQTDVEHVAFLAGVWPRITPRTIIQQLSLRNRPHLNSEWRNELIAYAQGFVECQKSERLILLAASGDTEEFCKELDFASGDDSLDIEDPDCLLLFLQIEGNFRARSLQRQVAREMISPSSDSNSVLQLNMGEGKSSVIVPIIAASLADSSRLVRVVVLKSLWRQMFELLVNRLSGLANRRIYYLPFGRHIRVDGSSLQALRNMHEECMREGGILLVQPEHILSFKLMGIDRLISASSSGDTSVAAALIETQAWLKAHTRDILDESDEVLHVRYRLVYTVGEQKPLDHHPDRWTTTQQLLRIAAIHLQILERKHPNSISYQHRDHGQFPTLRIMPDCQTEVEKSLISAIATDVIEDRLPNLSCGRLPLSIRQSLFEVLTNNKLPYTHYESLRRSFSSTMWKGILLVRGMLASGILIHVLKSKHYRVDYGLDLSRSLLAVPYRAKDIPSTRAEFGHPDVAVALTCLSYYYHGLTDQHLYLCFKHLFKIDNPSLEYEQWVKQSCTTPNDLKQLNGVNIKDRQQFSERLIPTFSHNPTTIDFFLTSVVFPREAKEFPKKLTTSGWDLAERKHHITTGFSGTNDNRYLLPTSVTQADPVKQLGTNALVLTYLLQPENNFYVCMRNEDGRKMSTEEFLQLLVAQTPEVRVLLDVGAQILDMQNEELVRCWLRLRPDIEAAVYFNNRDELVVLPQTGVPALLRSSPFSQRLDQCMVYLDDGHTRGTDLKLPRETRALVTLGPKVTKDRLLQGCMRMRKLGYGQSVLFTAPPEIDIQIRNAAPNPIKSELSIDALDIIRWAMLKTCQDLQYHVSQWAQQGIEFDRRLKAETQYEQNHDISMLHEGWTMPESRSLEEMYGVFSPKELHSTANFTQRSLDVPALRERLNLLGVERIEDLGMDEEQEREVDHEAERERQTQRPSKRKPAEHSIHPDVQRFVNTGTLHMGQSGILPLYHPFNTSNPQLSNICSRLLFASADFLHTVDELPINELSDYMRPINWVVTGPGWVGVILSPFEVNTLLPLIRRSSVVRLHLYAPRISLSMLSFSDLRFYSIPATPMSRVNSRVLSLAQLQLDLFSGQLYFSNYRDYTSLCAMLGLLVPSGNQDNLMIETESDGFVKPEHRSQLVDRRPAYSSCKLKNTPIPALKDLVERRRKGMKYLLTHVGQILHGRTLNPEDF